MGSSKTLNELDADITATHREIYKFREQLIILLKERKVILQFGLASAISVLITFTSILAFNMAPSLITRCLFWLLLGVNISFSVREYKLSKKIKVCKEIIANLEKIVEVAEKFKTITKRTMKNG